MFTLKHSIIAVVLSMSVTLVGMGGAGAALINFASGDGINESNDQTGTNVVIAPHPAWADVGGGAQWISFVNSGFPVPPNTLVPNVISRTRPDASALFTELLGFIDGFSLNVLGDDTVAVDLVNLDTNTTLPLFEPFLGQVNPCAPGDSGGVVGCTAASMGVVPFTALTPGNYALLVYGFQTNFDVFGVEYAGTVNAVPEPMTLGLLGVGLLGLGFVARRSRRASRIITSARC